MGVGVEVIRVTADALPLDGQKEGDGWFSGRGIDYLPADTKQAKK